MAPFIPFARVTVSSVLPGLILAALVAEPTAACAEHLGQPGGWPFGQARIGIEIQPMTPELREHMGAPPDRGVLVVRVEPEGPAAAAGVEVGDVATSVAGTALESPLQLVHAIHRAPAGKAVTLVVVRDGEQHSLEIAPRPHDVRPSWDGVDDWMGRLERGFEGGRDRLRHRLDDLERRLEELQKQLEERLSRNDPKAL